ncbi:MAG: hypothetical protein HKN13_07655, partial [Rhodothermales bacterium]|nr:hypothetical protein [Rhodothermales bacterium]
MNYSNWIPIVVVIGTLTGVMIVTRLPHSDARVAPPATSAETSLTEGSDSPAGYQNPDLSYATGTAFAYERDPSYGDPVTVTINRLFGDGSRLDGRYVRTISHAHDTDNLPTPASDGANGYFFTPRPDSQEVCTNFRDKCSLFDNVNAYYHVDRFAFEYWSGELGVENDFQVTVLTHAFLKSFAKGDTISLGTGSIFLRNHALEDEMIYHEYSHVVLSHLGFETDTLSSTQAWALGEGYADYFALSYLDQPVFANWATDCPARYECEGPPNDTTTRTMLTASNEWNWNNGDPSTQLKHGVCTRKHLEDLKCKISWVTFDDVYVWGMIWSSTLWDIRSSLGSEITDRLVLRSIERSGASIDSFVSAADAILSADSELYGGQHKERLLDIFEGRGIEALDTSVSTERDDVGDIFRLQTYPNPTAETVQVEIEINAATTVNLVLFDVNGRQVRSV